MSKFNWNKTRKSYASFSPERQLVLEKKAEARKQEKLRTRPASVKQIELMTKLGIQFPKNIYSADAAHLISQKLNETHKPTHNTVKPNDGWKRLANVEQSILQLTKRIEGLERLLKIKQTQLLTKNEVSFDDLINS